MGYVNSLIYVTMNVVISLAVALPAAYAFSRYNFMGDKHLFFWLLTNRMAPPAVFALPFFQLYSSVGLFDTHIAVALAHCLFNVPLAVWILEGFMRGVPKEIDETAYIDGYSFPRFFVKIFMPLIASGIGVAAFFCFMFSWVELLLTRTLTAVDAKPIAATMTRTVSASGMDWGVLAAAGVLTIVPGRAGDLLRPQLHRQGLCPGEGVMTNSRWTTIYLGLPPDHALAVLAFLSGPRPGPTRAACDWTEPLIPGGWMAWTFPVALFFWMHRQPSDHHDAAGHPLSRNAAPWRPADRDHARRPAVHLASWARPSSTWLALLLRRAALGRADPLPVYACGGLSLGLTGTYDPGAGRRPARRQQDQTSQHSGRNHMRLRKTATAMALALMAHSACPAWADIEAAKAFLDAEIGDLSVAGPRRRRKPKCSGSSTPPHPMQAWKSRSSRKPSTTHEYEVTGACPGLHRDHRHQGHP